MSDRFTWDAGEIEIDNRDAEDASQDAGADGKYLSAAQLDAMKATPPVAQPGAQPPKESP